MPTDLKLPELGEQIAGGDVLRVLVKAGDTLTKDQSVLELETDKATIEVPSSAAGVVKTVNVKAGDKVKVGQVILTVEEGAAATGNDFSKAVAEHAKKEGAVAVAISAKIESEIATLSREERAEFLDTLGLEEAGLDRLIRAGYQLLDLITYFTVGPKEARAWTIHRGTKAPAAAGVIHTDFEKGFIRAETIAYDDYVTLGGEAGARDSGKLRLEGKEYVVADGDVMHFRFNN